MSFDEKGFNPFLESVEAIHQNDENDSGETSFAWTTLNSHTIFQEPDELNNFTIGSKDCWAACIAMATEGVTGKDSRESFPIVLDRFKYLNKNFSDIFAEMRAQGLTPPPFMAKGRALLNSDGSLDPYHLIYHPQESQQLLEFALASMELPIAIEIQNGFFPESSSYIAALEKGMKEGKVPLLPTLVEHLGSQQAHLVALKNIQADRVVISDPYTTDRYIHLTRFKEMIDASYQEDPTGNLVIVAQAPIIWVKSQNQQKE